MVRLYLAVSVFVSPHNKKTKIHNIQSCMKYSISFQAPCYSSIQWRGMYGVDWWKEAYWWSGGLSKVAWGNGSEPCSDACSLTQRLQPHDQIGVVSVRARPDSFFSKGIYLSEFHAPLYISFWTSEGCNLLFRVIRLVSMLLLF